MKAKEVYSELVDLWKNEYKSIQSYQYKGKSVEQWSSYFTIKIRQNYDIVDIRSDLQTVADKLQEIDNICADLTFSTNILDTAIYKMIQEKEIYYINENLVKSKASAENRAKKEHIDDIASKRFAEAYLNFFNIQARKLRTVLDVLSKINMSLGMEMKHIQYQGMIND